MRAGGAVGNSGLCTVHSVTVPEMLGDDLGRFALAVLAEGDGLDVGSQGDEVAAGLAGEAIERLLVGIDRKRPVAARAADRTRAAPLRSRLLQVQTEHGDNL